MITHALPAPLVGPETDVRDLDGFMLNVERLMASELVALSSHEVVAAALFLWCRAWKQLPAASLPNDERVIAAFARLPLTRFRKLRDEVMRGFVLCSDGRWYHQVLAEEATRAYGRKQRFQAKRETDAERLRKWRAGRGGTDQLWEETRARIFSRDGFECTKCGDTADLHCDHIVEIRDGGKTEDGNLTTLCRTCHSRKTAVRNDGVRVSPTRGETHFVAEGQGQGQGQGIVNPCEPPAIPEPQLARGEVAIPTPAGAICKALRAQGVDAQPADPRVLMIAEQGVALPTIEAAARQAREAKGPNARIPVGYVLSILERWSEEARVLSLGNAQAPPLGGKAGHVAATVAAFTGRTTGQDGGDNGRTVDGIAQRIAG